MPLSLTNINKKTALATNLVEALQADSDITDIIPSGNIRDKMQDLINLVQEDPNSFPLAQVFVMGSKVIQGEDDMIGETDWSLTPVLRFAAIFDNEDTAYNWTRSTSDLVESKLIHNTLWDIVEDLVDMETECEVVAFSRGGNIWYMAGFVTTINVTVYVPD